jgi:AraC-like DNA-binding protein
MQQQAVGDSLVHEALLRAYLHALLLRCTSLLRQQVPPPVYPARPGLFLRFRQLLEQYYTEWKSVAAYADQLCVTPNHLSVSIKRETGRPASDHIRQRIMLEAQRLAAAHDAPLKEIAYQLGFEDVAHFSKLFKRCHGVSFSSFKAQARQQHAGLVVA